KDDIENAINIKSDSIEKLVPIIVDNINGTIGAVMYPVFSRKQGDKVALKSMLRRSIKISSYLVFPMMMGMIICAEPIVRLVLGVQWLPCVPFLQGWCMCYALMPVHTANLQVYNALGRSDIFLYLEIIKKVLGVATLLITLPFGLEWMMFGRICNTLLAGVINAFPNIFIIKYKFSEQLLDLLPSFLITLTMGGMVYFCKFIPIHYLGILAIQVLMGMAIYIVLSVIFRLESFKYILDIIKKQLGKRKLGKGVTEDKK
ncbi:MAG: oligosaccharide flippase family protein, partial [Clostridia bacterium]